MGKWKSEEICNDDMIHDKLLGEVRGLRKGPCEECNLFCYKKAKPCLKFNNKNTTIPGYFYRFKCDDGTFHTSYYDPDDCDSD